MKTFLLIAVLIGCTAYRSFAQEPVPLEVWTSVKGSLDAFEFPLGISGGMSYIPNFKNGAIPHAFIVNYRPFDATFEQRDGKVFTWGFSNPTDTINRYTWAGKNFIPIFTPDVNGDGYRDFMNKDGLYYLGTQNDEPDTINQYNIDGNFAKIDKFNSDNSDDFFYYGSGKIPNPYLAHFIFSNPTLKNFKKYSVISKNVLQDSMSEEIAKAIYKNKQGKWRLLTYCRGWIDGVYTNVTVAEKSSMRLYALEFNKITEDSTAVEAIQIDEYKDPKWLEYEEDIYTKDMIQWKPLNDQRLLYTTENHPRIFYYASLNTLPDKDKNYNSYAANIDLTQDEISIKNAGIERLVLLGKVLNHSIDGDKREDIIRQDGDWKTLLISIDDDGTPIVNSTFDTESVLSRGRLVTAYSVDDLNNDGVNDIACLFSNNSIGNSFVIIKGKTVVSPVQELSDVIITEPYPLPNNNMLLIPLLIKRAANYNISLYSTSGTMVKNVFSGEFDMGSHTVRCTTSDITSGSYLLKVSDGKNTTDRLIIINR